MEIVVALFFVWLVVTLIGHASWVLLRALFGLFDVDVEPPAQKQQRQDWEATNRVLTRLVDAELISRERAVELHKQLRILRYGKPAEPLAPTARPTPAVTAKKSVSKPVISAAATESVEEEEPILAALVVSEDSTPDAVEQVPAEPQQPSAPLAPSVDRNVPMPPRTDLVVPLPPQPVLRRSEMIHSFLAAHNIRWGELVAGMLIVICSIGLVRSLWSTLVDTHRVIPSLIFLTANAAIYAAGLYTLARWRLRHTSRAVIVIATLLVPLSVLAGIAAAGTGRDAVPLDDPITLVTITIAGLIYTALLWLGGRALTGPYAPNVTLSVAGPVFALPLVPAAVRAFGSDAGWLLSVASLAIVVSLVWMIRRRRRGTRRLGLVAARSRLLVISLCGFALAAAVGYTTLAMSDFGTAAYLPIAIAIVPALISIAAIGVSLSKSAISGWQQMTGGVVATIAIGVCWALFPASMTSPGWLFVWAGTLSIAGLLVGWLCSQSRWLPASTMPIGLALVVSSPAWIGGLAWDSIPWWSRILGGEAMLAAALVAATVAVITAFVRDPERRRQMIYAPLIWTGVMIVSAGMICVGPDQLLGAVPWWSPVLVLACGSAASVYLSSRNALWSYATIAAISLGWFAVFRPLQVLAAGQWIGPPENWMHTGLAISATWVVIVEVAPRIKYLCGPPLDRAVSLFHIASLATALISALIAVVSAYQDWQLSAWVLAATTVLIFWSATADRSVNWLRLAQFSSVALAVVIGCGRFSDQLVVASAWQSGQAIWGWAIAASLVTLLWLSVRQVAMLQWGPTQPRLAFIADPATAPTSMLDGWTAGSAAVLVTLAAGLLFLTRLIEVSPGQSMFGNPGHVLPAMAFVAAVLAAVGARRFQLPAVHAALSGLIPMIGMSLIIWLATISSDWISDDVTIRLVVATTIAAIGIAATPLVLPYKGNTTDNYFGRGFSATVVTLLVVSASAVLLQEGWLAKILDRQQADALPSTAVALWWLAGSFASWYGARRTASVGLATIAASLVPAATIVFVPIFEPSNPIQWLQWAASASLLWALLNRKLLGNEERVTFELAIDGSLVGGIAVGTLSALAITFHILFDFPGTNLAADPIGVALAIATTVLCCTGWLPTPQRSVLPWPIGVTLLAGSLAWVTCQSGLVATVLAPEVLMTIVAAAAVASLVLYHRERQRLLFWHTVIVTCLGMCLGLFLNVSTTYWLPGIALAFSVCSGLTVVSTGNDNAATTEQIIATRILGWLAIVLGIVAMERFSSGRGLEFDWTVIVTWVSGWVVVWRGLCVDRDSRASTAIRSVPDSEFAWLVMVGAISEVVFLIAMPDAYSVQLVGSLLAVRVGAYLAITVSSVGRGARMEAWLPAIVLIATSTSLVGLKIVDHYETSVAQRAMLVSITSTFIIALLAFRLPMLVRTLNRIGQLIPGMTAIHLIAVGRAMFAVGAAAAISMIGLSAGMIALNVDPSICRMTIVSVALVTWTWIALAELTLVTRARDIAVSLALVTIALWASVDTGETSYVWLSASMRWLVASVVTVPLIGLGLGRVLSAEALARWQPSLKRAAIVATLVAAGSLVVMLMIEAAVRDVTGIQGISLPMVIGVAIILVILSVILALAAVLSGPSAKASGTFIASLVDSSQQRRGLIIAAQAMGGLTWLHVFLCKAEWAFVGIREYWPFIVMGIAFLSVGVTEWARRRDDRVLWETLCQTALYLPLIPVIGFWLTGTMADQAWVFAGGKVRYDLLLALVTVYYVMLSMMWQQSTVRIVAVVLGNAAFWVVLAQRPDWSFLTHPQAWLIPPAVCVLVAAQRYRDALPPTTMSAIRYASTLVIYISSTADMLLQQIGESISGPIILVVLALCGMLAGVIFQVRPFLYVGAAFVFVGVTSMVWHAQRSLDAVWPWWVFGITTGMVLLAALMALEKNKDRLRHYAQTLASWQG